MEFERSGRGSPLLMVHGLGGNRHSFDTIAGPLSKERELLIVDLPGHGTSAGEADSGTFAGLVKSLERFLVEHQLRGIDMVGISMGGRLVLEMARRGLGGNVVALDPGGFWQGWERTFFKTTIGASAKLLRGLRPTLPALTRNPVSRTLLLAQLSARPWALDGQAVATELKSYTDTSTFDALARDLAKGPAQTGPADPSTKRLVIGWGRHDRLCLARQAMRAQKAFPSATLHWFEHSGHFPMWDEPRETIRVILDATK